MHINEREKVGTGHLEDFNTTKKRRVLIVFN